MNIKDYLTWVDENDLDIREQRRVLSRVHDNGGSLAEVDQEDLERIAQDIGILRRALRRVWGFFSNIF